VEGRWQLTAIRNSPQASASTARPSSVQSFTCSRCRRPLLMQLWAKATQDTACGTSTLELHLFLSLYYSLPCVFAIAYAQCMPNAFFCRHAPAYGTQGIQQDLSIHACGMDSTKHCCVVMLLHVHMQFTEFAYNSLYGAFS